MELGPGVKASGRKEQRGMGGYTLCGQCNNNTGSWYGGRFVDWCYQGMNILEMTNGKPTMFYMNYVFPLSIIKQIVTMFFSVNGENFRLLHPDLVSFVLNRNAKYLPPKYRFFAYFNLEGRYRATGVSAVLNTDAGRFSVFSEITFPPYGYVMTFGTDAPDRRMVEITHFTRYDLHEWSVIELKLPTLPTHLSLPGDYRSIEEIMRNAPG
jgi:hypothetical protein